jgi:hypothetical protein
MLHLLYSLAKRFQLGEWLALSYCKVAAWVKGQAV